MRQRRCAGKPAEITFTSDFHELATGDLRPGRSLLLRYDPHRIVPAGEAYRFGDPDRPLRAHVQFAEGVLPLEVPLRSHAGIIPCPDVDLTGQGSMLAAVLSVPSDADLVIVWFSYDSATGTAVYDSDYGANYRFGFPCREIEAAETLVSERPDGATDRLDIVIRAAPEVDDVIVQYILVADPACVEHDLQLRRTGPYTAQPETGPYTAQPETGPYTAQPETGPYTAQPEAVAWAASADIPHRATVHFRVCYWIGGRRLIDDDGGAWYLAPEPAPDQPPPPSAALLAAAAAWG